MLLHEHQLGISGLPEQEVAEAFFAAGPDHQIGIRHVGGEEITLDQILIDPIGRDASRQRAPRAPVRAVELDVPQPAVSSASEDEDSWSDRSDRWCADDSATARTVIHNELLTERFSDFLSDRAR